MVSMKISAVLLVAVLMMVVATKVAEGQPAPPSCASSLIPCANFLNVTNPPSSCCDPLRDAVTTQLPCLCNLYSNPAFLANFGINITQALELPGRCNIPGDISACRAPAPGTLPPSRPGQVPGRNDGNGVGKIARTGLSSFLLLWASLMLF